MFNLLNNNNSGVGGSSGAAGKSNKLKEVDHDPFKLGGASSSNTGGTMSFNEPANAMSDAQA